MGGLADVLFSKVLEERGGMGDGELQRVCLLCFHGNGGAWFDMINKFEDWCCLDR